MKTINCNNGWYLGLGDLLCYAWLAAGARAAGEEVAWFATGWRAEVLRLCGVEPTDEAEGSLMTKGGFEAARHAGEDISYIEAMARELGISSPPLRPRLNITLRDPGNFVLLSPHTTSPARQWPAAYWVELAWILESHGIKTHVVLHARDERYVTRVPFWSADLSHADFFSLAASAKLILSNDSGPAHLGGTLGISTLVMAGPTAQPTFSHYSSVKVLSDNSLGCQGCYYGKSYRSACDLGCQALFRLLPETVAEVVVKLLTPQSPSPISQIPTAAPRRRKKGGAS